jgi:NAD-dependent deacetylase
MKKKLIAITGAGISAESGIKTFRDSGGLWEGHDVMEVATPEGWKANPELVLDFYNQRRRQLLACQPNDAHLALAKLEEQFEVEIITQNVDDLHERSGSKNVLHLHGELLKARSSIDPELIYNWNEDILMGMKCDKGSQLRPGIIWFGEEVPAISYAIKKMLIADCILIIGTSLQVYPAAGLISYAPQNAQVIYIDPKPAPNYEMNNLKNLKIIAMNAVPGMKELLREGFQI